MQTQTQTHQTESPLDIIQQFDELLKNHSIVVADRENLTKLFQSLVDLCTQMPKTKLKAAIKAATHEPKTTKPRAKAQPKPKTQTQAQPNDIMVGPDGAADAPMISDLVAAPVARGRGRPRTAPVSTAAAAEANANPNAETAEKKRRGRPKKDKSVTISSNDDEDALIEKMMADVASMQKDAHPAEAVVIADPATDDDETEDEASPIQTFTGPLMRCEELTPVAALTPVAPAAAEESLSPVVQTSSSYSFQTFDVEVPSPKTKNPAKESKAKAVKAVKAVKATTAKAEAVKAVKATAAKAAKAEAVKPKAVKVTAAKADAVNETVIEVASAAHQIASAAPLVASPTPLASFSENKETNGKIYLRSMVPTESFSYNGKTYLRTETDNVYDNLTHELIGVWDHSNHEIITAFDADDELYFSDEEE